MNKIKMLVMGLVLLTMTSCKTILTSEIPISVLFSGGCVEVVATSVCYVGEGCDDGIKTTVDAVDVITHENRDMLGSSDVGVYYSERKTLILYLSKDQIEKIFEMAQKYNITRRDVEIKFELLNDTSRSVYITLSGSWVDGTPLDATATTFEIQPYERIEIQLSDSQTWYWLASGVIGVGTVYIRH